MEGQGGRGFESKHWVRVTERKLRTLHADTPAQCNLPEREIDTPDNRARVPNHFSHLHGHSHTTQHRHGPQNRHRCAAVTLPSLLDLHVEAPRTQNLHDNKG